MLVHKTSIKRPLQPGSFNHAVPPILRPVLRAYLLGYVSSTAPRVLTLFLTHLSQRKKNAEGNSHHTFNASLIQILRGGLELQRFPTFCAALVGGSSFLQFPVRALIAQFLSSISLAAQLRLARFLSTFIAAWFSLKLVQYKKSEAFVDYVPDESIAGAPPRPIHFAGKTMDLTLFAATRALDVLVGELWSRRKTERIAAGKWTKIDNLTSKLTDPAVFASSCALIMWAWIYSPDRLPRSYKKWIKSAAAVDQRLLLALQRTRFGEIKYGVETGQAHLLESMCKEYNFPLEYGDPVKSIPFPCELVHMGTGRSCEYHALSRWVKSFIWAFSTYLPLNLVLALRNPNKAGLQKAIKSSARSSAFLGTFITLFYYGICLTRTRIGPSLLGTSTSMRQQIDSGICIGMGCTLCGWSILVENSGRRKELGLFVAPRALATIFPRRYRWEEQWRETILFAGSAAVVFTCVKEKPGRVRGVLGKVLGRVLAE